MDLFSMERRLFKGLGTFAHHALGRTTPACETRRWEGQEDWVSPLPSYCFQISLGQGMAMNSFPRQNCLKALSECGDAVDSGKLNTGIRPCVPLQGPHRAESPYRAMKRRPNSRILFRLFTSRFSLCGYGSFWCFQGKMCLRMKPS